MNNDIINKWNSVVKDDDIVYVLGDYCLGTKEQLYEVTSKLKGHKILVMGNHDRLARKYFLEAGFEQVIKNPIIVDGIFILSHKPIDIELGQLYNIHGHKHKLPSEPQVSNKHFDVGVDDNNFYLRELGQVEKQTVRQKKEQKQENSKVRTAKRLFSFFYRVLQK